jgi:nitrogen regulatory protein PII
MTKDTKLRTLLTVITEAAIEETLVKDLEKVGVVGYTISDVRGRGERGMRDAAWGDVSNIRIEIICSRSLAEKALHHLQRHYFDNFAMVTFMQEVEVARPDKF